MNEPTVQQEPTQQSKPPVKSTHIIGMNAADAAYQCDLSAYPGLNYAILSLMPSNDVVARWHIT